MESKQVKYPADESDVESATVKEFNYKFEGVLDKAGTVHVGEFQGFGRGLKQEIRESVGTWWPQVSALNS